MSRTLRIASRGSELALWQSRAVESALRTADPSVRVEIGVVRTTGDRIQDVPLAKIGDKGLFTKELDEALQRGDADLAVHSLKDVPTRLPEGLVLAAVTERADPRDVLLAREPGATLAGLPAGARVGTSSLRRRSQLGATRPDLDVVDLRGNLNTRLARLDAGDYHAIVLAAAGVLRLGWAERVSEYLDPRVFLPAVGQGALAVVCRADDAETRALLRPLHHLPTAAATTAERAFLSALEGGCQVPIGALGTVEGEILTLHGLVAGIDGGTILRAEEAGRVEEAESLGRRLADDLLEAGAGGLLDSIRAASAVAPSAPAP